MRGGALQTQKHRKLQPLNFKDEGGVTWGAGGQGEAVPWGKTKENNANGEVRGPRFVGEISKRLDDEDWHVRDAACRALASVGAPRVCLCTGNCNSSARKCGD